MMLRRSASAWIGDQTLCYLANGKPGVVQHSGPSQIGCLFRLGYNKPLLTSNRRLR
jgi:hypothetical protein